MKIGLFYDTAKDHKLDTDSLYFDFSSIEEVEYVKRNLEVLGHSIIMISDIKEFIRNIEFYKDNIDIVFNMYEGIKSRNRESLVPAVCEAYEIPYTGSDAFGTALTLNKFFLRLYVVTLGIKVPYCIRVINTQQLKTIINDWNFFPCIIKPEHEGSSMGISLVYDKNELSASVNRILQDYAQPALIEEYIKGTEVSVCVIEKNNEPFIVSIKQFSTLNGEDISVFDRDTKKLANHESFESKLPQQQLESIIEQSSRIFVNLPLHDVARIDWRIKYNGEPYLLEVTPLPDWQPDAEFENEDVDLTTTFTQILLNTLERFHHEK